ncbi:MAG: HD domain-containing phosphohydrolase [Thermoleophilia bacterium]
MEIKAKDILDRMMEGCQIIDYDWRFLYVNDAAVRHGRMPREQLLGHTMMEAYPGIEQTPLYAAVKLCMDSRQACDMENEFRFADGETGWFELRMQPIPEGVFILSIDITNRKLAESEIAAQLSHLRSLRSVDLAILGSTDMRLALRNVLEEAINHLEIDAATVYLFKPEALVLEAAQSLGFGTPIENSRMRLGESVVGKAALKRRTIIAATRQEIDVQGANPAIFQQEDVQTLIGVPLIAKGRLTGVLELAKREPFDPDGDWLDFLEIFASQATLAIDAGRSFEDLQRSHMELALAYDNTIEGWSSAMELRDNETKGHTLRVTGMTMKLLRLAGISEAELTHARRGALLHDIGKMGVPDAILFKNGKLSPEEWAVMRKHPEYAFRLLSPIAYLKPALDIPYYHHEKWDGSGYPAQLAGEHIPVAARLFAIVDVWDALNCERPYRQAWPEEKVQAYIHAQTGSHFEPRAVDMFFRMLGGEERRSRAGMARQSQ